MDEEVQIAEIWIEAEQWKSNDWDIIDGNTDVIVRMNNREQWIATFVTYKNILTLIEKNRQSGENLSGAYLWVSDMILVDEISRLKIEVIIIELVNNGDFESVFRIIAEDGDKKLS